MNNSNGIAKRQNEERSIRMLAAQRELYSEAKAVSGVNIVLSVIIPFALSCIGEVIDNPALEMIMCGFSIISFISGMLCETYTQHKRSKAAYIQQQFDVYVFNMPWDRKLFDEERSETSLIAEKSEKHMKHNDINDLYNWYTVSVDTLPLNKAILSCQKENYTWDGDNKKRYRFFVCVFSIVLAAIIAIVGLVRNEPSQELFIKFGFILPILVWLITVVRKLNADIKSLNELDGKINRIGKKDMEELQEIQKSIFEHRNSTYSIPDWFYKLFKDKDEKKAEITVKLDRENS